MQFLRLRDDSTLWSARKNGHRLVRHHDSISGNAIWGWCATCERSVWNYTNTNAWAHKHVDEAGRVDAEDEPRDLLVQRTHERMLVDSREARAYAERLGGIDVPFRLGLVSDRFGNLSRRTAWDYRNCIALFGYAFAVHVESGARCRYCDLGSGEEPTFETWRQMHLEHIIGREQDGELASIAEAVASKFEELEANQHHGLIEAIHTANTTTACALCNSFVSRKAFTLADGTDTISLTQLIAGGPNDPAELLRAVLQAIDRVSSAKRAECLPKAAAVKHEFETRFLSALREHREIARS